MIYHIKLNIFVFIEIFPKKKKYISCVIYPSQSTLSHSFCGFHVTYKKMPKFSIKISNLKFKQFFKKCKYSRLLEKF